VIKKYKINEYEGKIILKNIFSMLIGLIKSTSSNRIYDDAEEYKVEEKDINLLNNNIDHDNDHDKDKN
jgi:hypothetical protein